MFSTSTPEHTGFKADERHRRRHPTDIGRSEADVDNFSAGQAHDANIEHGAMLSIGDPFDMMHADDNLGDEAAFPSTWQHLASGDAPND